MLQRAAPCGMPQSWDNEVGGGWVVAVAILVAAAAATALIAWGDADRGLATAVAAWNEARGGKVQDRWWWLLPYHLPGVLVAAVACGVVVAWWRGARRQAAYVALVLALGSGLLVNAILKDHWGRPRPRDTVGLGGDQAYRQPWQPGGEGRSFPSGHVTVPALAIALWLLWRRNRPWLAGWTLVGGLALCIWIGAARVLSGAHWLSDLVWALAVMAALAALLYRPLIGGRGPPAASATAGVPSPV